MPTSKRKGRRQMWKKVRKGNKNLQTIARSLQFMLSWNIDLAKECGGCWSDWEPCSLGFLRVLGGWFARVKFWVIDLKQFLFFVEWKEKKEHPKRQNAISWKTWLGSPSFPQPTAANSCETGKPGPRSWINHWELISTRNWASRPRVFLFFFKIFKTLKK